MSPYATAFRRHLAALVVVSLLAAVPLVLLASRNSGGSSDNAGAPQMALVAAGPARVRVKEIPLSGDDVIAGGTGGVGRPGMMLLPRTTAAISKGRVLTSTPQTASGYATVGVTWAINPQEQVGDVVLLVRTRNNGGGWSEWVDFEYDAAHGPDVKSAEGRGLRAGTDPFPVGEVALVQVRVVVNKGGRLPRDIRLSIIDPGSPRLVRREEAAISAESVSEGGAYQASSADKGVTSRPAIFSRSQWGADERMRDADSLHYGRVTLGFVHHTVNANDYSREQVPALLRGIYAYHTQSKGWSDIGYNFVVDRFGRIWEGRYGGVDRAVVGAHTLGYNDVSFAASALGNFETTRATDGMIDAYGRLYAWKMSLHGVKPDGRVRIGSKSFMSISGHSDADSTACPGRYLYARLPDIRAKAAAAQHTFGPRQRDADLQGTAWPDLVLRDAATKRAVVLRTGGQVTYRYSRTMAKDWSGKDIITASGDLTSDGIPDLVARTKSTAAAAVYPGTSSGALGTPIAAPASFAGLDQLSGVHDLTGDKIPDLVGRVRDTKRLVLYPGNGAGGFKRRIALADTWAQFNLTAGVGDMTGDGMPDLIARDGADLYLFPGRAKSLGSPRQLPGAWDAYDRIAGLGDAANDGGPDLIARRRDNQMAYIYRGDGQGNLQRPLGPFATFKNATHLGVAGDLAGTRHPDIVARRADGSLALFENTGRRNVSKLVTTDVALTDSNRILNVGDWNGDGRGDIITRQQRTGALQLRAGAAGATFSPPVSMGVTASGLKLVAVGDLTGDGYPDLVSQDRDGVRRLLPGNGFAGFTREFVISSGDSSYTPVAIGLWDADGSPDLLDLASGQLTLRGGNGPAYLFGRGAMVGNSSGFSWVSGLGDVDGDGRADAIGRRAGTGELWLIPGGGGSFGDPRFITDGLEKYDLASS